MDNSLYRCSRIALMALAVSIATHTCAAQQLIFTPFNPTGIYQVGEPAGWTVSVAPGAPTPDKRYSYVVKTNNLEIIKTADLDFAAGNPKIEVTLDRPAMLYAEVAPPSGGALVALGAAVAPDKLQPVVPRPADFDDFWKAKLQALRDVPPNAVLTPGDSGEADVDYAVIRMDHLDGRHVWGQIAKPKRPGKFPALVIFQWASPPYPLEKAWVTSRAKQGWLCLNIEPHDVPPNESPEFYAALPEELKHYESIGNDDRDKSYFAQMYQADVRAVDYITSHPDWDGKTIVVMGTSMGGMQSLATAGLHDKVTHLIVNVPAGCDTNAPLHGRQLGYPFFPAGNPKVMETALYVDPINFASRIKAQSLVAMGFVDTISPPAGIWTAYNQITAPKEVVPLVDSPHNHLATPAQQAPYVRRAEQWLAALVKGVPIPPPGEGATGFDDHRNMMDQLGVKSLRPGADPNRQDTFDEAQANRFADSMPDALTRNDGTKVAAADQWPQRREELVELFAREIYGRIPPNVPPITWQVTSTTPGEARFTGPGGAEQVIPTITKTLIGHVDNTAFPQIAVDVQASFTVPAEGDQPRPIIVMFGGFGRFFRPPPGTVPWTDQAIAHGWAYAAINPGSIQPDNNNFGAGIIGLTKRDQPRQPDDWGALRAWQWGASRLLDYFEQNPDSKIDPTKFGIAGLSRFGKAAIVTQAFDPRIAVGFIGSSGEGGVKLHRHIFGEAVENLTGGGYYWMAGNFIKYGAAEATFGPKTAADLPIDQHELLALCAPRPCFISYGTTDGGDPNWVDARGSFMAGVLAGPVYRLLGKKDFGTPGDYLSDSMPPVGELIGGELAWRQHNGGHDLTPNWPTFFEWVSRYIEAPPTPLPRREGTGEGPATAASTQSTDAQQTSRIPPLAAPPSEGGGPLAAAQPAERTDPNSRLAHQQLLAKAKAGRIDAYFLGDSITRRWGASDPQYKPFLENWNQNFHGWNAANFGWGGDTTQNILWRLEHGELDGVNPKVIVLLAGTNNIGNQPPADPDAKAEEIAGGVEAILKLCRAKAPGATIILTAVFPRNDNMAVMPTVNRLNERLARLADGKQVRFLNVNDKLADTAGKLFDGMMHDGLHPALPGYQAWADGLKPLLTELLGPPAKEDHAPPPTGDPSALPTRQPATVP